MRNCNRRGSGCGFFVSVTLSIAIALLFALGFIPIVNAAIWIMFGLGLLTLVCH